MRRAKQLYKTRDLPGDALVLKQKYNPEIKTAFCTGNNENHLIKLMCRFHKKSAYNKKYSFYLFYAYNRHLTPLIPFAFLTSIPRGRHV